MKTLPANVLVTLKNQEFLLEEDTLVAPCNLYAALSNLIDKAAEGRHWSITIKPTDMAYFMGDD